MSKSSLIVTGSSGYIASALIPELTRHGYSVKGIDRVRSDSVPLDGFLQADLNEIDGQSDFFDGAELILHLAAAKGDWGISDSEYQRDNVDATKALIDTALKAGIRRWVFFSTVSTIGPSSSGLDETASTEPINAYGQTKLACERLFSDITGDDPRMEVLSIRPSVVFGPGNPWNTNIYRLIDAIYRRRFVMVGDGQTIKSSSYIENLVAATVFLLDFLEPGHSIYHYLDEPQLRTGELVTRIYELLEKRKPRFYIPLGVVRHVARVFDVMATALSRDLPITSARIEKFCTSTHFDSGKIRSIGFDQPVSNDVALEKTVESYLTTRAQGSHTDLS